MPSVIDNESPICLFKEKLMKTITKNDYKFDENWCKQGTKTRAIHFFFQANKDIIGYQQTCQEIINYLCSELLSKLKNKEISEIELKQYSMPDKLWNEYDDFLINKGLYLQRQKRSSAKRAIELIKSYLIRNKKLPKTPPRIRRSTSTYCVDGVCSYKSSEFSKQEGIFNITTCGLNEKNKPNKIKIPYFIPKGMVENFDFISKSFGGNLITNKNQCRFTAITKVPINWIYEPINAISFDLNKTEEFFITLSDKIQWNKELTRFLPHTKSIRNRMKQLNQINKEIDDTQYKSSQRRGMRKKSRKLHNKLKQLVIPYCNSIINHAIENKMLICLDGCAPGAGSGSFGQDKVLEIMTKILEDKSIPFVRVPSPHTSSCCNICNHEVERDHKGSEKATCINCGRIDSHLNAAENIKKWGVMIWSKGIKEWIKWKKENFVRHKIKNSGLNNGV